MDEALGWLVTALLLAAAAGGLHRFGLGVAVLRGAAGPRVPEFDGSWPSVTIQLPVYNEPAVARRLLSSVGRLAAPRDRVDIQILDDSTDETRDRVDEGVAGLRAAGWRVSVLRRVERAGFKAGALAAGLNETTAEFVAIFDADFAPEPDFLQRTLPGFATDVAVVQARWAFLDGGRSWLARAQALALNAHFSVEHEARYRGGRWFNFNGTAGIWRRAAIDDAGGWSGDTLTEDLDLSYRAQLRGWRFVYLDDVGVPCELPASLRDFMVQQQRWATGGIQCAVRLVPRIALADAPLLTRVEAVAHLVQNLSHPILLALALLWPWVAAGWIRLPDGPWDWLLPVGLAPTAVFLGAAAWRRGDFFALPATILVGIGLCYSQTRAVLSAGRSREFVRTPKPGTGASAPADAGWWERRLAAYELVGALGATASSVGHSAWFCWLLAGSFAVIGLEGRRSAKAKGPQVTGHSHHGSRHVPPALSQVTSTR
jgi:hypothetical protein